MLFRQARSIVLAMTPLFALLTFLIGTYAMEMAPDEIKVDQEISTPFKLSKDLLDWFDTAWPSDNVHFALDLLEKAFNSWIKDVRLIDDPNLLVTHWKNHKAPISDNHRPFYRREMLSCTILFLMDYYFGNRISFDLYPEQDKEAIIKFQFCLKNVIETIDLNKLQNADSINVRELNLDVMSETDIGQGHAHLFDLIRNFMVDKMELMNALKANNLVLRGRIGAGTFGVVFKVHSANSELGTYALKSFHSKEECKIEERLLNRLKDQRTSLGGPLMIAHIQRNEAINCEKTSSFLMDYIDGVNCRFRDVAKYIPFHPGGFIGFINTFGGTLENLIGEIAAKKLSHSDISPGNVMYNPQTYQFYLIDWGSATDLSELENLTDFYSSFPYYSPSGWALHRNVIITQKGMKSDRIMELNERLALKNDYYAIASAQLEIIGEYAISEHLFSPYYRENFGRLQNHANVVACKLNDLVIHKSNHEWGVEGFSYNVQSVETPGTAQLNIAVKALRANFQQMNTGKAGSDDDDKKEKPERICMTCKMI